jgi:hypothetical protein
VQPISALLVLAALLAHPVVGAVLLTHECRRLVQQIGPGQGMAELVDDEPVDQGSGQPGVQHPQQA